MAGNKRSGRKRKPTALKVVEGTYREDRANPREPVAPEGAIAPPPWLSAYALEHWRELEPILDAMGLLDVSSAPMFAALCEAYADWRHAKEYVEKHGAYYKRDKRELKRPALQERESAWRRYQVACGEFGLTPASRGRAEARPSAPPPKAKKGEFERFGLG